MTEPGTSIQVWGDYDDEAVAQDEKTYAKTTAFYKMDENRALIGFLPGKAPLKSPFILTFQHEGKLVPGVKGSYVRINCPRRMNVGPCPLCAYLDPKYNSGSKSEKEYAYELFAKKKVYAVVLDREDSDAEPKVFKFGAQIYEQLMDEKEEHGNIFHPLTGRDIKIKREGTKRDTEYKLRIAGEPKPIFEDAKDMSELASKIQDMRQFAEVLPAHKIKEMMAAAMGAVDGEDEDEKPVRNAARRGARSSDGSIETDGETVSSSAKGSDMFDGDDGF
jgi:hypothetical protein